MKSFRYLLLHCGFMPWLLACPVLPQVIPAPVADQSLRCGDGIEGADEACDDGLRNSNSRADACRKDCRLAHCGDNVTDTGESCDDGNPFNADGCSTDCALEEGEFEEEPNDGTGDDAQLLLSGMTVYGVLEERDQDCYAIRVPNQGYLTVQVGDGQGGCLGDTYLRLYGPDGETVLVRDDNSGVDGCSKIDPHEVQGARHLDSGLHSVCVQGFLDIPVSGYALSIELGANSCSPGVFEPIDALDNDNDGVLDACDDDDDDDRIPDEEDNCPKVSNGPYAPVFHPNYEGFIRHWLLLGAWDNELARCLPTEDGLVQDEEGLQPEPFQLTENREWQPHTDGDAYIDLNQVFPFDQQYEAYAFAHVHAPAAQRALLAVGSDDGMRAWLNGQMVTESADCRGAQPDQNVAEINLQEGWNRLLIRVKDLGGGWGFYARFLNEDRTPVRGLKIQHTREIAHDDNQIDRDGNGTGDACERD
ncbi:MAG: hypothetical protein CMH50_12970 [Myxococcales bacterium]|nr:hypothetical protein [Myxococcales bacterium]